MYLQCQIDWGSGFVNVPPPRNIEEAKFEISWTSSTPSASLQSISFEWVNTENCTNATDVWKYRLQGLAGGKGVGEGLPFRVYIGGTTVKVFDGVIDLPNAATEWECDMVKAPLKRTGGVDWFMDQAAAIPCRILADYGIIGPPPGDPNYNPASLSATTTKLFYKKTPYIITFRDWEQALMLFLEEFSMIQHTLQALTQTGKDIGTLVGTATNVPFPTIPEVIAEVVELVVQIVYDAALILSLIALTEQLINTTVGVKKYKYCMRVEDIINGGLYYMNNFLGSVTPNLEFSSTILQGTGYGGQFLNTTIMPKKNLKVPTNGNGALFGSFGSAGVILSGGALIVGNEAYPGTVGPPYGYPDKTLKQVFTDYLMPVFNAEVLVADNKVYFEEKHFWDNKASFIVPNVSKPGYTYNDPDPHKLNYSELQSIYITRFMTDGGDEMTIKNYRGTSAECSMLPNTVGNVLNLLPMKPLDLIFQVALGKRKVTLNIAEQVVNDILNAVASIVNTLFVDPINALITGINWVLKLVGAKPIKLLATMPYNTLFNRFGWLEVSNDTWEEAKMFIGCNGQLNNGVYDWELYPDLIPGAVAAPNNANWNMNPDLGPYQTKVPQYYTQDSPGIPENAMSAISIMNQFHGFNFITRGNQWLLYNNKTFRLLTPDFQTILNNNVFTTPTGKYGKFDKVLWDPTNELAETVDYRINEQYDNNFYESISIDGFQ